MKSLCIGIVMTMLLAFTVSMTETAMPHIEKFEVTNEQSLLTGE